MQKLKIATIVGTRPEIIRLSRVLSALDECCEHTLIHTGQNYDYELNEIFFKEMGLRPPSIYLEAAGKSSAETIGNVIIEADKALELISPDGILVLGDTNSCLSVIAAKRKKIPIFHMEAGNRCFDLRVPEEINRKIVDHISDINMTYSDIAREYLLREGIAPDCIVKTGSPMYEVLKFYEEKIASSTILEGLSLEYGGYFLISAHREENIGTDKNFNRLVEIINLLATNYQIPVIVSTHPRTRKRIDEGLIRFDEKVRLIKPLGFMDYIKLQISSKAVLSDSGTISEESSILNFPALNLREAHERPEAMEEASVILVGLNKERVLQGLSILESQNRGILRTMNPVKDYMSANVSQKVVRIILSYCDYVHRSTWKNY